MSENDYGERIRKLNDALNTPIMRNQFVSWTNEKKESRVMIKSYWAEHEGQFAQFWHSPAELNIKEALILTALEDIPQSMMESFSDVVCPELNSLRDDVVDFLRITQSGGTTTDKFSDRVFNIVRSIINETENDKNSFDSSIIEKEIQGNIQKSSFALQFLLLSRSCLLLQFVTNLWLLFLNRHNLMMEGDETPIDDEDEED